MAQVGFDCAQRVVLYVQRTLCVVFIAHAPLVAQSRHIQDGGPSMPVGVDPCILECMF